MRLSGRQTKKGREITAPALLERMLKLLSAQELLEFMTPEEIKGGPHGLFGVEMGRYLWLSGEVSTHQQGIGRPAGSPASGSWKEWCFCPVFLSSICGEV